MKKKFEISQEIEYAQRVKFLNLENFHMGILQKQACALTNMHRVLC